MDEHPFNIPIDNQTQFNSIQLHGYKVLGICIYNYLMDFYSQQNRNKEGMKDKTADEQGIREGGRVSFIHTHEYYLHVYTHLLRLLSLYFNCFYKLNYSIYCKAL